MQSVTAILLLAFVAQAHVKELDDNALVDKLVDRLITRAVDKLVDVLPLNDSDLDSTTLAKDGWEEFKNNALPMKINVKGQLDSAAEWPVKPDQSIHSTWESDPGYGLHCTLKTSDSWPDTRSRTIKVEKKIGEVCCALESPAEYPLKPTASAKGQYVIKDIGSVKYDLKTELDSQMIDPANFPPEVSGKVTLEKKMGDTTCALKTKPAWPLSPTASVSHTLKSDKGSLCFGLESPLEANPKLKATIDSKYEADFGTISSTLESSLTPDSMKASKPTGSISLKKKFGKLCCNVEGKTSGMIKCTVDGDVSLKD